MVKLKKALRYRYRVLGGLSELRGTLAEMVSALLERAIVECEDCEHFQISEDSGRVVVEYDGTGYCSESEYVDAEYAGAIEGLVESWIGGHGAEYERHLILAKKAAKKDRVKIGMGMSKHYETEKAAGEAAERAGELKQAAAHYGEALEVLEWEIASEEYGQRNRVKAGRKAAEESERISALRREAAAMAAKVSGLTGKTVAVRRKRFSPAAFSAKIREWAEAEVAAEMGMPEPEKLTCEEMRALNRELVEALTAAIVEKATAAVGKSEEKETVEGTLRTPDRDVAEAAMFFLVELLGEDEFVGYDETDGVYSVYFGTNITAATYGKIAEYVKANGLSAEFQGAEKFAA